MKIIISPAKKMNVARDDFSPEGLPVLIDNTKEILALLKEMDYDQLKKLWKCNDKIAEVNYQRLREMNLEDGLTPAIFSYEGLQYQHMSPKVLTEGGLAYIQENLRILSGFYGILKPFDGVTPYRLEMQSKLSVNNSKDLYDYWGSRLYDELRADGCHNNCIVNLASKEYSQVIEPYLSNDDLFITCIFGQLSDGKVIQKGTMAKMARGDMVRYMAENNIQNAEEIKGYNGLGYTFDEVRSTETEYVFLKL